MPPEEGGGPEGRPPRKRRERGDCVRCPAGAGAVAAGGLPPFLRLARPARGGGGGRARWRIVAARRWPALLFRGLRCVAAPCFCLAEGRGSDADGASLSRDEGAIERDGESATALEVAASELCARPTRGGSSSGPKRAMNWPAGVSAVKLELRAGMARPFSGVVAPPKSALADVSPGAGGFF